ncbi:hypothetical protein [Duganella violaceipulchra]|uniref:Uncharacterized protein n=1 Tax=Duganella violaceipulchra TaxID=2849652 RepID=A0AA41HD33_9BURK|nr:hypothetical protein [Duganella violaceicalia]MBV6321936.1 hypothetical protein [Duganella violaceicalia]MCP2007070.1 hypothetical protein [Duganella violaceicalia]
MTRIVKIFPPAGSRSRALLIALQQGPGTFYQVCERANFDIEDSRLELALRHIFDHMIGGNVSLRGLTYSLTEDARISLGEAPPAPYVGQVAGPAYRGTAYTAPVKIARRAAGAHA